MKRNYEEYLTQAMEWKAGKSGRKNTFFMATKGDAVKLKNFLKNNNFKCSEIIWQQLNLVYYNKKRKWRF